MNKTGIEYCDYTWNPIIGCSHCSPGCDNCWAEKMACRIYGLSKSDINKRAYASVLKFNGDKPTGWNGNVHLIPERLNEPLKVKKPSRIFVCDMGDLFHPGVPDRFIDSIWARMSLCPQHTFLILTKRPERMKEFVSEIGVFNYNIIPNVWLGVTVCNQHEADEKIPILLQIPAAKRFVSVEPMLGEIDMTRISKPNQGVVSANVLDEHGYYSGIKWVICGCESGNNRRITKIEWVESLREQCVSAKVPFFLKQLEYGGRIVKMPDLDWIIWDQIPED